MEMDRRDEASTRDPFLLGGARKSGPRDEDADLTTHSYDGWSGQWIGPDQMARGETRLIRRSCALFEEEDPNLSYGRNFNIRMQSLAGDEMNARMQAFSNNMPMKSRDKLVDQQKVPPVGYGPAERMRKEAVSVRVVNAEGENGKEVHATMRAGPGGFGEGYESSGCFSVLIASIILTEWDIIPPARRGFVTGSYLLSGTSIFEQLADNLMIFECHDGRATQDLFRSVMGGFLALDTDTKAIGADEGQDALKPIDMRKRLPWFIGE